MSNKPTYEELEQRVKEFSHFRESLKTLTAVLQSKDIEDIVKKVLDVVFSIFKPDRIWLFYPCDPKAQTFKVLSEKNIPEFPGAFTTGQELPVTPDAAITIQKAIDSDSPIVFDPESGNDLDDIAKQFSVQSQIIIAIHPKFGAPWMFGMHQCAYPRVWTKYEQNLFQEISQRFVETLSNLILLRELEQSEKKYRSILDNASTAIFIKDKKGKYLFINSMFEKIHGITNTDIQGKKDNDIFPKELADQFRINDNSVFTSSKPITIEELVPHNDGIHTVLSTKFPLFDNDGKAYAICGIATDITDRKKAEKKLLENEERYRLISNATTDYVYSAKMYSDYTTSIDWAGGAFEEITGYNIDEINSLPQGWLSIVNPEDFKKMLNEDTFHEELHNEKLKSEYRITTKHGNIRWLFDRVIKIEDLENGVSHVIGGVQDITGQKQAEEALRENEAKYRHLYEKMLQGVVLQDADGKIIEANNAACKILGLSIDQMLGKTAYDPRWKLINEDGSPYDPAEMPSNIALKTGKPVDDTFCGIYVPENDEYRWILINSTPQFKKDEANPFLTMTVFTDITERIQLEKNFQQAQKMEAIGTLAGGIAHDFNNMLGVISGNVSYLSSRYKDNDDLVEVLSDIDEGVLNSQKLTQQLLTFAKGGAPIKKITNINHIVEESAKFVTRGAKAKCNFDLSQDLWATEVDSGQLNQVFSSLVINANQAMPNGGLITIRSEKTTIDKNITIPLSAGNYIKIIIEDQGIGISEKHLPNIFDPYFSTKQAGSGLGLATTYSIIKRHGGHIAVDSKLDKGTTFTIYLPATTMESETIQLKELSTHSGQGKILVMDDEAPVLKVSKRILTSMGYEVEFAKDGHEAIKKYNQEFSSGNPFDLVILDLTIPGDMGGAETIPEILKINPEAKIVVSSGYSNDPLMANYKNYGLTGIIPKPYRQSQMAGLLNKIMGEKD